MHLLHEFLVGESAQIQIIRFFFGHKGITLREITLAKQPPILWVNPPASVSTATRRRRIATLEINDSISLKIVPRPNRGEDSNETD